MPTTKRTLKKSPKKMTRSARLKRYESVYSKALRRGGTGSAAKSKVRKAPRKSPRRKTTNPRNETRGKNKSTRAKIVKPKKIKPSPTKQKKTVSSPQRSKKLTAYQKFVKTESKKTKYKNMVPQKRLVAIGAAWKSKNKKK